MGPIIGVLANYHWDNQGDYVMSIRRAGGSPVIIPILEEIESIKPVVEKLDGIIFSGGTDIDPKFYKEHPRFGLGQVRPERDMYEIDLLNYILKEKQIPILGICRGMQLLNVVLGGSLYQNLERERPEGLKHWLDNFPKDYPSHIVKIEENSRFFSIFNEETLRVNSFHNQAIRRIAEGLKPTVFAPDEVIEGVEMEGERFVVGVQFHPEMMISKCQQQLLLFKELVKQCHLEGAKGYG